MSIINGVFVRDGGDDRCQQEAQTGTGEISSLNMDTEFNDFAGALNQCLFRDGSNVITANINFDGNNLLNVGQITGDVSMPGLVTFSGGLSSPGQANFGSGLNVFGSFSAYAASNLIDGDLLVTGEITNSLMPQSGTWTPTIYGSSTAGTFNYAQQTGTWTSIGDDVWFSLQITGNWTVSPVGSIRISIPHTIATGSQSVIKNIIHSQVAADSDILARGVSTQDYLTLNKYGTNGSTNAITDADQISSINEVIIQGKYIKA